MVAALVNPASSNLLWVERADDCSTNSSVSEKQAERQRDRAHTSCNRLDCDDDIKHVARIVAADGDLQENLYVCLVAEVREAVADAKTEAVHTNVKRM